MHILFFSFIVSYSSSVQLLRQKQSVKFDTITQYIYKF